MRYKIVTNWYSMIFYLYNIDALFVERATSKPTPICIHFSLYQYLAYCKMQYTHTSKGMWLLHIPRASTVAMLKTTPESCEVSIRQEQSVK